MYEFEFKHPTIDWERVPIGSRIDAVIHGVKVSGRVQKDEDGEIFICHNSTSRILSDYLAIDSLGFKKSYSLGYYGEFVEEDNRIIILSIDEDEEFENKNLFLTVDGEKTKVVFSKGKVQVGCCTIPNEMVEKIYKYLIK